MQCSFGGHQPNLHTFSPQSSCLHFVQGGVCPALQADRSEVAQALFERYLAVEQKFSPLLKKKLTADQIYAEFIGENKEQWWDLRIFQVK